MSLYTMKLSDSVDTMEFNLLEVPIQDKDIEGAVDNVVLSGDIYTDFLWLKKRFTHKWSILCKDDYERLRGFYTRQFSNAEVPIYQLLDAPSPVEESAGSGEYIQITTTDSTAKLASVEMLGNAEQTTYSGKNLLPSINTTRTINGVTFTPQADGSIKVSGTATEQTTYPINTNSTSVAKTVTIEAGTYTIGEAGTGVPYVQVIYQETGGSNQYKTGAFTTTTTASLGAYIRVNSGVTANTTIYPQLEKGSTATAYEPYVGGTASPNPEYPQEVKVVTGENTVKITGKNLFDKSNVVVGYVNNSGTISTGGGGDRTTAEYIPAQSEAEYTISGSTFLEIAQYDSAQKFIKIDTTTSAKTLTVTTESNTSFIRASAYYGDNTPDVQLEKGTATEFEAYHGQSYEINLGKNLLENTHAIGSTTTNGMTFTVNSDGTITLNGTATALTWFVFHSAQLDLPDGTYTISLQGGTNANIGVYNDKFGNTALGSSTTKTITSASGNVSLRVASGATASNLTVKPMIERGSQATSYAPYFTPIELAKIGNYQDRIYKTDGKWYIEKQVGKVVLDGTQTLNLRNTSTNGTYTYSMGTSFNYKIEASASVLSDYFASLHTVNGVAKMYDGSSDGLLDTLGISLYYNQNQPTSQSVYINSNRQLTASWLASNPTTVYYVLATPTTTEITNEALIAQLDALGTASLYLGVNNIGTETQNAVPTLALTYFPYYPHEIISPKAVRMELTDGGIINACECRENVQITLRETIQ